LEHSWREILHAHQKEPRIWGDEIFSVEYLVLGKKVGEHIAQYRFKIPFTWNQIFAGVAPTMINWVSTEDLKITFMSFLQNRTEKELRNAGTFESMGRFKFSDEDIDTAIVQFRALGLIEENQRQWKLTNTVTTS
jgi:hypothetical protein